MTSAFYKCAWGWFNLQSFPTWFQLNFKWNSPGGSRTFSSDTFWWSLYLSSNSFLSELQRVRGQLSTQTGDTLWCPSIVSLIFPLIIAESSPGRLSTQTGGDRRWKLNLIRETIVHDPRSSIPNPQSMIHDAQSDQGGNWELRDTVRSFELRDSSQFTI